MPSFGKASRAKLDTVDSRIVEILEEAIKLIDFTVLVGHRNEEDQNKAVAEGKSKLSWPKSKHNSLPSKAVDIAPWIDGKAEFNDTRYYYYMAGIIMNIAATKGYKIRWGGCWKMDNNFKANSFNDLVHFEVLDD